MGFWGTIISIVLAVATIILVAKASDGIGKFLKGLILAFIVSLLVFWFFDLLAPLPLLVLPLLMFVFIIINLYTHRDS